jgi:hypothetical protein
MKTTLIICLSIAKINEVMFIYKYDENVISAKKEIQFEKSYLKSLPNQNQQLGNNPLMLITHTVMIKKYVVQKNRIILKKKKRVFYT